jgi:hypothetical protein
MRKSLAVAMALVAMTFATPAGLLAAVSGAAPGQTGQTQTGTLTGTAKDAAGNELPKVEVRARQLNPPPGQSGLAGTVTTDANGAFTFSNLTPADYIVEIVVNGRVVGVTPAVTVAAGQVVNVSVSAALSALAGAAAGGGGLLNLGTLGTVLVVGGAAGLIAIAATRDDASPSR